MDNVKTMKQGSTPVGAGGDGRKPLLSTNAKYFPGAYWGPSADWARPDTKTTAVRYTPLNYGGGRY